MPATARARQPKSSPRPRLYTTDEVAALTGRSAVAVKLRSLRFQAAGQQFGQKVGRQWLYTEDEVREMAAIPASRGRFPKALIEKRRRELANVPLDKLADYAEPDSIGSDPEPAS
jgi:hypothetical protein